VLVPGVCLRLLFWPDSSWSGFGVLG
jgi:hypothetical protein